MITLSFEGIDGVISFLKEYHLKILQFSLIYGEDPDGNDKETKWRMTIPTTIYREIFNG